MSHTTQTKSTITDEAILKAAAGAIPGAEYLGPGEVEFFSDSATGWRVRLPDFSFPVVVDPVTGKLSFDTYNGQWGDEKEIDRLRQQYAVEAGRVFADSIGGSLSTTQLENGHIECTISLGGGLESGGSSSLPGTGLPSL